MAREPIRKATGNQTSVAGGARKKTDRVLSVLKFGNGLVSVMAGILAAVLILYSGYVLYDSISTEYGAYSSAWELQQYKPAAAPAESSGETVSLADINEDYRAWLTVNDTKIDYPVVQGVNDLYYAAHDVYKEASLTGAIYLAAANTGDLTDSYNLVYGHHMDNGAMFGSLDKFLDGDYFHGHQAGTVIAKSGIYDLTLFAAVTTDAYENKIYRVGNRAAEVISFLTGDRNHDTGVGTTVVVYDKDTAQGAEKILAMSTCADAATNGRLVVFGKLTLRETVTPTPEPTATPTATPTETPSDEPTATPTATLTATPIGTPSDEPTATPTVTPTGTPTGTPSDEPTATPTATPTGTPSDEPTATPTPKPTGHTTEETTPAPTDEEEPEETPEPKNGPYNLEIRYEYLDGKTAAPTYHGLYMPGEEYERVNPIIGGYVTARTEVRGIMGESDVVIVVLYIPEIIADRGETISIDEYEIPLGLNDLYAQMGIGIE